MGVDSATLLLENLNKRNKKDIKEGIPWSPPTVPKAPAIKATTPPEHQPPNPQNKVVTIKAGTPPTK